VSLARYKRYQAAAVEKWLEECAKSRNHDSWPRGSVRALRLADPMLSRPGPLPSGSGWSFELKWDGFRALVSTEDDLRVRSRRGWTSWPRSRCSLGDLRRGFNKQRPVGRLALGEVEVSRCQHRNCEGNRQAMRHERAEPRIEELG
jgi:hypothetical protein